MNAAVLSLRSKAGLCHRYGVPDLFRLGHTTRHVTKTTRRPRQEVDPTCRDICCGTCYYFVHSCCRSHSPHF